MVKMHKSFIFNKSGFKGRPDAARHPVFRHVAMLIGDVFPFSLGGEIHRIVVFLAGRIEARQEQHLVLLIGAHHAVVDRLHIIRGVDGPAVDLGDDEAVFHACILERAVLESGHLDAVGDAQVAFRLVAQLHEGAAYLCEVTLLGDGGVALHVAQSARLGILLVVADVGDRYAVAGAELVELLHEACMVGHLNIVDGRYHVVLLESELLGRAAVGHRGDDKS